ncbi:ECM3 [Candida pseudojiufengensis]|uniref:ECM3 n=1 Tax=Candida pseudojiufengensis TaxID=497109 RepID=UPI002224D925|nr:ECM3 [Candida pseudojiufengensis]KAI5964905.1 ECM3 [Candida pseudojiufengensis]
MSDSSSESLSLGLVIYSSVKPIFKIYFIIALGFFLAKRNILTVTTCRDISDTVVTAIMPCLIFTNMVSYLKSSDIKNVGIIIFTSILLFLAGGLMAFANHIVTGSPKRWLGGLLSVGIFPNISDLPIAYIQTFAKGGKIFTTEEGSKGVAYVCIFLMGMILFQFTFGLYRLIEWDFRDELLVDDMEKNRQISNSSSSSDDKEDGEKEGELIPSNNLDTENKDKSEAVKNERQEGPVRPTDSNVTDISSDLESINSNTTEAERRRNKIMNDDDQHNEFLKAQSKKSDRLSNSISRKRSTRSTRSSINPTDTKSRRDSINSITSNPYGLEMVPSRGNDIRRQQSQDVNDVINEYSEFDTLRNNEIQKEKSRQESLANSNHSDHNVVDEVEKKESKFKSYAKTMFKNLTSPNSVALLGSIAICMSPPLKALFVPTTFYMPNAPDEQPPLSFIIDLTSYIGAASVPLGLLLLGATLARLKVKNMAPGFWKTAILVTAMRLIILPIFGVGVTTGMYKGGWYGHDRLVRFVSVLEFGLPNATSLVYFTAFYTDPQSEEHLQMDCLAICLIFQYLVLWFSLPFLITFTLKVSMGL